MARLESQVKGGFYPTPPEVVEAVAKLYAGRAVVGKLNVDENPATAKALGVKAIPTLIVFKDGREVKRLVGLSSEAKLKAALDSALGSK